MKKVLSLLLLAFMPMLASMPVQAYDFENGGFRYNIVGNDYISVEVARNPSYSGDIVIPNSVYYDGNTYTVTGIGKMAFSDIVNIKSVTIPNSVTYIDQYAFEDGFMTSVTIGSGVKSIGMGAFQTCRNLKTIISERTNPIEIGDNVFSNYTTQATLIVPAGSKSAYQSKAAWNKFQDIVEFEKKRTIHVATAGTLPDLIKDYEKYYIEELTLTGELNGTDLGFLREMAGRSKEISFLWSDKDLSNIDDHDFYNPETQGRLINLDIINANIVSGGSPYLVTKDDDGWKNYYYSSDNTIPAGLFNSCKLTSIKLPRNISSIESLAFYKCSSLTSVTIPNSVTSIGENAFSSTGWCKNQPDGLIYAGKVAYGYKGEMPANTQITIKDGTLGIAEFAFGGRSGLTSVTIPNSVTSIGDHAFQYCSGLTSVTIGNSVTYIGKLAFDDCTGLSSVIIGCSVTSIGDRAFGGCSGLTSVTIPNSVTSIGNYAFQYCSGLTSIVSKIKKPFKIDGPFDNNIYASAKLTVPYGTKSLYESTEGWNKFQNIVEADPIDERVIYEKDFTGITEFTDWSEFDESQTDGKVGVDPNGVAITVGIQTGELWQPQVMVVPDVLDLEKGGNYRVVVTAKFPTNGSMRINMGSWSDYYQDVFPITATDDFQKIVCDFYDWPANFKDAHILFQCGDFKGTTIVKKIQVIDMGDTVIPFSVGGISYLLNLKDKIAKVTQNPQKYQGNVTIPATITYKGEVYIVTSIDKNAFQGCSDLSSVTIPNSVTRIEDNAFEGCIGLKSVIIPNNVIVIGDRAFYGCSGLTSVTIGKSVTSIGDEAFRGCSGLPSVTIPNSVTSIGGGAFVECTGLTSVTIPNSVTSISWNAFENCSGLTSVTIPNSETFIGREAFYGCSGLKFICLASDKYPSSSIGNTSCQYIMPQSAFDAGIPQDITNYATYTVAPKYITVKSTTATKATLELTPIDLTGGSTGATPYEVTMYDLKPGSSVKGSWELGTKDRGLVSIPTVTTKNLVMNVQPAKLLSKEKAGLVATVDEPDDDKHYGFEWQRNDAPSNMTPYQVQAQLYEGKIIGTLSGLDPDKYYKYRPFYKADDGTLFRGEWEAFITGDATVMFEPDVHTKESVVLPDGNIELTLVLEDGTAKTLEKGFELRIIVRQGAATRFDWSAEDENITRVVVSGDGTSATVEGLEPGTEYAYRAYVKTESGTIYGEEKTFKTPLPGDANDNGAVDAADIVELVNAKAGHPSASFNLKNADANADGSFTEADITATADIIMKR